ncbi:MAG: UDP-2,3-diacylglucosamine diphosphatase [Candidatus Latescibacteria bacterium]|nr:UDP-2,3-diacylglucosamine diphosphatase [Candidatus Latescibacterota bacterium]
MAESTGNLPDRIAFIADAHLGMPGDDPAHAGRVAAFIRSLTGRVSHLYILGDLFDFWFEYGSVVPSIAPRVVFELYNLSRSGVAITLFAGNHDYWLGPYLRDHVGLAIEPDGLTAGHQGLRLYLHHGDGLYPDDYGYRLLKRVLRHPLSIRLFRLIHPDLASRIAKLSSKTSREYLAPPKHRDHYVTLFRGIADRRLDEGFDGVVYGHSHVPLIERRPAGTLVLLGDMLNHYSYVILENGLFSLHTWNPEKEYGNG